MQVGGVLKGFLIILAHTKTSKRISCIDIRQAAPPCRSAGGPIGRAGAWPRPTTCAACALAR